MQELKARTRNMEMVVEVLRKENEDLKQKISGSRENKHMQARECNAKDVKVNEVDKKNMYNKLQSLASKYEKL